MSRDQFLILACVIASIASAWALIAGPAEARQLHHRRPAVRGSTTEVRPAAIPQGYSFYPHEIEGGVSGNLPFNNQIRKFRDPLNANGAGG